MIGIEEFEKRINALLKFFKKRTKALACYMIDTDGFIITSFKDEIMEKEVFSKKIIDLFSAIESLSKKHKELIDFHNKRGFISVAVEEGFFRNGFTILLKSVGNNLIFLTIFPTLVNYEQIFAEFDKTVNELSNYFIDDENKEKWKKLYNLI
ncbi:MAG: hypothetical protein ACFFAN_03435 [Promethearchaeota archaeon]